MQTLIKNVFLLNFAHEFIMSFLIFLRSLLISQFHPRTGLNSKGLKV